MLQQILRDMYVDPDILAELPEEQKEMLFIKIREEQIRRYNEREKQNSSLKNRQTKPGKKVRVLEDAEGNPWTWVYGEAVGEITVEEKWRRISEERMDSVIQAVIQEEEEQLQKAHVYAKKSPSLANNRKESTRTNLLAVKQKTARKSPSTSPRTSPSTTPVLKRIPLPRSPTQSPVTRRKEAKGKLSPANSNNGSASITRVRTPPSPGQRPKIEVHHTKDAALRKKTASSSQDEVDGVERREESSKQATSSTALSNLEKLRRGEGSKKIPGFQRKQLAQDKAAAASGGETEQQVHDDEDAECIYESFDPSPKQQDDISTEEWQVQLRRFKEEDARRSFRARRASIEVRRQSEIAANPELLRKNFNRLATENNAKLRLQRPALPPKPSALRVKHPIVRAGKSSKPQNRLEVIEWFEETQLGIFEGPDAPRPPAWFHGIITRQTAEELLKEKTKGDYLVRVSDKIWGYALSYRDDNKYKHFLIDASEMGCYHFFGNDQIRHDTLLDLIEYHKEESISYNGEKLCSWVGQLDASKPDYAGLDAKVSDTRL